MSRLRPWLGIGLVLLLALPAAAENPLRLVPAQADVFLQIDRPRDLLESITTLEAVREFQKLDGFREYYASTNFRRFTQLLALFEKKLGKSSNELLDVVAGDGAVLALKFAKDPTPSLLVLQGRDAEQMKAFAQLAREIVIEEMARKEGKSSPETVVYRDIEGTKIGTEFYLAVVDKALLVSNHEAAIKAAIDLHFDGDANSVLKRAGVTEARQRLAAKDTLAWVWLNFEKARQDPQVKVVFDTFFDEPGFSFIFGGIADVMKRSSYLCLGLTKTDDGFGLQLRLPAGQIGRSEIAQLLLPSAKEGSLNLLEPKDVLFSMSTYFDMSTYWQNRSRLTNADGKKGFDDLEKKSAGFLQGSKLSEVLKQAGPHQRFVYVMQNQSTFYTKKPRTNYGAFALIQETVSPDFGKSVSNAIRTAALVGSFQFGMRLYEEKHGDTSLVGYRFAEDFQVKDDTNQTRFNFTPCFAQVGNHFFVSSTIELGRELIDLLAKEKTQLQPNPTQMRLYAKGTAESLRNGKDQFVTGTILNQALTPAEAIRQTEAFFRIVENLGGARLENLYAPDEYQLDLRIQLGKRIQ